MQVLTNDFQRQWEIIAADAVAAVSRVGAGGRYILGSEVERFERALAAHWGVPHAVGVGSGLDALSIALRCSGIRPGDKVLTTPLSAFATTQAIIMAGAVPVYVDVDASGLLDLDRCRQVLYDDRGIRFLMPVHLFGHSLDLDALAAIRYDLGTVLVEDCAQSIGASWRGTPTATVGDVAGVSFYPTKNLGALGDGGAVLTPSPEAAEQARALRHYGQTATYVHDYLGLNSRLDEMHAAILHDAMLPRLQTWTARRRAVASRYRAQISNPRITLPHVPTGCESVWHLFPVLVEATERARFMEFLRHAGVQSGIHYPKLITDQRALHSYGKAEVLGLLTHAERFAQGEVSLPVHPLLTDEEVEVVIAACNAWGGA